MTNHDTITRKTTNAKRLFNIFLYFLRFTFDVLQNHFCHWNFGACLVFGIWSLEF